MNGTTYGGAPALEGMTNEEVQHELQAVYGVSPEQGASLDMLRDRLEDERLARPWVGGKPPLT